MEKEITAYGISRSITLLLIFLAAFIGITFVFVESIFNSSYPTFIKALFGSLNGLALFGVIYGTIRYYSEEIIVTNAINFASILSQYVSVDEEECIVEEE